MIKEAKLSESDAKVCRKWDITSSGFAYIKSHEAEYLKLKELKYNPNLKRRPSETTVSVDQKIKGYVTEMDRRHIPVTRNFILHVARESYHGKGLVDFRGSPGYIQNLKKRIKVKRKILHGESNSVDELALRKWEIQSYDRICEYNSKDIFNCDETALVIRMLPNSTWVIEDKENNTSNHGVKKDKTRLSVLCNCSLHGEKRKLVVIGKHARPRCFAKISYDYDKLPVDYYCNKTAWMTSKIFTDIIQKWDDELVLAGPKVLLLLDNFSGHRIEFVPKNIQFLFLLPNPTSLSQPLDAGIIKSFKDKYMAKGHYAKERENLPFMDFFFKYFF